MNSLALRDRHLAHPRCERSLRCGQSVGNGWGGSVRPSPIIEGCVACVTALSGVML
ncbi:hypothetical protein [Alloprevotella tannerae]|uniref:Uncharacterized protein n=1 Tax=Alloprevotella tannerae TaxID=76122 RepID=A0A929RWG8_9BACT|nr:hypothetical protein [Alloprevotella tannerae]MBF0970577.1 hypothetical protein [Alloprevotella tannerae]